MHNQHFHILYYILYILYIYILSRAIKLSRMRCVGHVVSTRDKKKSIQNLRQPEGSDHLSDICASGKIILNWILKKQVTGT
jgi:hypothetical protein